VFLGKAGFPREVLVGWGSVGVLLMALGVVRVRSVGKLSGPGGSVPVI